MTHSIRGLTRTFQHLILSYRAHRVSLVAPPRRSMLHCLTDIHRCVYREEWIVRLCAVLIYVDFFQRWSHFTFFHNMGSPGNTTTQASFFRCHILRFVLSIGCVVSWKESPKHLRLNRVPRYQEVACSWKTHVAPPGGQYLRGLIVIPNQNSILFFFHISIKGTTFLIAVSRKQKTPDFIACYFRHYNSYNRTAWANNTTQCHETATLYGASYGGYWSKRHPTAAHQRQQLRHLFGALGNSNWVRFIAPPVRSSYRYLSPPLFVPILLKFLKIIKGETRMEYHILQNSLLW